MSYIASSSLASLVNSALCPAAQNPIYFVHFAIRNPQCHGYMQSMWPLTCFHKNSRSVVRNYRGRVYIWTRWALEEHWKIMKAMFVLKGPMANPKLTRQWVKLMCYPNMNFSQHLPCKTIIRYYKLSLSGAKFFRNISQSTHSERPICPSHLGHLLTYGCCLWSCWFWSTSW